MDTAAAEAGRLAGRIQPGQRDAAIGQHPSRQVGLEAAERLACEDM